LTSIRPGDGLNNRDEFITIIKYRENLTRILGILLPMVLTERFWDMGRWRHFIDFVIIYITFGQCDHW
jgi:hypothetical protein